MLQAYIKPTRQPYTRQKDLPEFEYQAYSREIVGDNLTPKGVDSEAPPKLRQQRIERQINGLRIAPKTQYVCKGYGRIHGCIVHKDGRLTVTQHGRASNILVYDILYAEAGGYVEDVELRDKGRLVIAPGVKVKRVFKKDTTCTIVCETGGRYTEAKVSRVTVPNNI